VNLSVPLDYEAAAAKDDKIDLRVWLRLLSCSNMIEAEIRRRLRREFDMTLPWFDAMAQLYRADDGLTMSELSQRLMVTNGNVTSLIDRMAAEGHAVRRAEPHDQRVQRARLTRKGRSAFEKVHPAHRQWVSELMAGANQRDLAHLYESLGGLKATLAAALDSTSSQSERQV